MHLLARLSLAFSALVLPAAALVIGPYTTDANTVHLFHLDEAAGATSAANAVAGAAPLIAFDGNPANNNATTAQAVNPTVLAAAAFTGFGKAASIATPDLGLGMDANASGGFQMGANGGASPDAILHSSLAGADGSFTLEAMVRFPAITGAQREIFCTDNSFPDTARGFQFRINAKGNLEFNFIATTPQAATAVTIAATAAIPTAGAHAFVANEWFHVALSHNGATHASTFYWTRVAPSSTAAHAIGTSASETTLGSVSAPLVIGNEARAIAIAGADLSSEGLLGFIDEVRVSKIARTASQFIFAATNPTPAPIMGPYTPDANTTHLFHLDEAAGATSAANAVSAAAPLIAFDGDPANNSPTTAQAANTTVLGTKAFNGFGKAANISSPDLGLGLDASASGGFQMGANDGASPDAILHASLAGADGSFTLEAMVCLPAITGAQREIFCTDNSFADASRGFQFRINTLGNLEFNFIATTPQATKTAAAAATAAIPTAGAHGFVANEWFHVALSHNGATHASTFYWTRVAPSSTAAHAIGTSAGEISLGSVSAPLVIGNEARAIASAALSSEGLLGLIDEVRVSKIARTANQFIFAPKGGQHFQNAPSGSALPPR